MGGASCKAKVVLNGGTVESGAHNLCYLVGETPDEALTYDQWIEVVRHLNTAEEAVNKAQRAFLEALGFTGPWPQSMKSVFKQDSPHGETKPY